MKLVLKCYWHKFEIAIVWEKVEYDDFHLIKAVFKDDVCNVESADYSNMTKVQTWPGEIAIALISLIAWGLYLVRRKDYKMYNNKKNFLIEILFLLFN